MAHGGGMADYLPGSPVARKPMAVEDAGAYGGSIGQAHGGLPCSIRHRIGLSLGIHIVSSLVPS
jgi:hypothetical protein